jgi:hypothetical protein
MRTTGEIPATALVVDRKDAMGHHPGNNPSWRRRNTMRKFSWFLVAVTISMSLCLVAANGSWAKDTRREGLIPAQASSLVAPLPTDPNANQPLLDLDKKIQDLQRQRQKLNELQRRRQLGFQTEMLDLDDKINELNQEKQKIEKDQRRQQLNLQIHQLDFEQKTQALNQERQKLQREQNRQNLKDQIEMLDFDLKSQELQQKRQELEMALRTQRLKGQSETSPQQGRQQ